MKRFFAQLCCVVCLLFGAFFHVQAQAPGLYVNEASNGSEGSEDYIEYFVVADCDGLDLRGYIMDDNNGDFSGGPGSGRGIAPGHFRFKNIAQWESVPSGTIILLYSADDFDAGLIPANDETDANGDNVYIIPSDGNSIEVCNALPSTSDDSYGPCTYSNAAPNDWTNVGSLRNGGDAAQSRNPDGTYGHGIAFGDDSDMEGGPDNLLVSDLDGRNMVFYFVDTDPRDVNNWMVGDALSGDEIPGAPNNAANAAFIANLSSGSSGTYTVAAANNGPLCEGDNLSLTATPSPAGTYTFEWSGPDSYSQTGTPATRNNVTTAQAGDYTVTVTDNSGCSVTATTNVTITPAPVATATADKATYCVGESADFSSTPNGAGTYAWSGPNGFSIANDQNPTRTNLTTADAGTYTVTITSGSCSSTATVDILVNDLPNATANNNGPICIAETAVFNATPTGLNYAWSGPNAFSNTSNPAQRSNTQLTDAGTYTVTVTDNNNCSATATTDLVINDKPTANPTNDGPKCLGEDINLDAGIAGAASYTWTGPDNFSDNTQTPTIFDLSAAKTGTYQVIVENANGCFDTATTDVSANPIATFTTSNTGPYCVTSNLQLNVDLGGQTYSWTGPNSFTSNQQNPAKPNVTKADSGMYYLTLTDGGGCTYNDSTLVIVNDELTVLPTATDPICAGEVLQFDVAPAAQPTYSWSGPNGFTETIQDPTINNANPAMHNGTYQVTVTDANGCTGTDAIVVVVGSKPNPSASAVSNNLCVGDNLNLSASPNGFNYAWTGPDNFSTNNQNPIINNVTLAKAGTYKVVIEDNGCTDSTTIDITVNETPSVDLGNDTTVCANEPVNVNATALNATYLWHDNNTDAVRTFTLAATTTVQVTVTAGSCTDSDDKVITIAPNPAPNLTSPVALCEGTTADLETTTPGTYLWSTGATTASITVSPAVDSTFRLTVTSAIGCVDSGFVLVDVEPSPEANISGISAICEGDSTTLNAGSGPGFFTWSDGTTGPLNVVKPIDNTVYSVTSTIGTCTVSDNFTVTVFDRPTYNYTPFNPEACANESITLTANVSGTVTSFDWEYGSTTNMQTVTLAATEFVTLTTEDDKGCTWNDSVEVTIHRFPTADVENDNTGEVNFCGLTADVSAIRSVGVGTWTVAGPHSATFASVNSANTVLTVNNFGSFQVTWTEDNFGCTDAETVTLNFFDDPTPSITADRAQVCAGDVVNLSVDQTYPDYAWSTNQTTQSIQRMPTVTTNYEVTVTDVNGCSASTNESVAVNQLPQIDFSTSPSNVCPSTGVITLNPTVTAGSGAISSFAWTGDIAPLSATNIRNPQFNAAGLPDNSTHNLTLTVTDNNNCTTQDDFEVRVLPEILFQLPTISRLCDGESVTINGSNPIVFQGSGNYNFTWSGPALIVDPAVENATIQPGIGTHIYTLTVDDVATGCAAQANTTVEVNPNPTVNVQNTIGCLGVPQAIEVVNAQTTERYEWSNGQSGRTAIFAFDQGLETHTITVTDGNNCTATQTFDVIAEELAIDIDPDVLTEAAENSLVELKLIGPEAAVYQWTPAQYLDDATKRNPQARIVTTTEFSVIARNQQGCEGTASILIENLAPEVAIAAPTAFTPNGDGINDSFIIKHRSVIEITGMLIYNRWGEKVFHFPAIAPEPFWTGHYKDKLQPQEVYSYIIKAINTETKEDITLSGNVTILQ